MQKLKLFFLLALFLGAFLTSCKKDEDVKDQTNQIEYTLDGEFFAHNWTTGGINVDSVPGGTYSTSIWGASTDQHQVISLYFISENQNGTYPIEGMYLKEYELDMTQSNLSVTVSSTGQVGDLLSGTFSGTAVALDGSSHTISGSYNVVRTE